MTKTTSHSKEEGMTTAITVQQRAIIAIGGSQYESDLRALAAKSSEITAITNKAGLEQCHVSRMNLKRERLDIGKKASAATEDAKLFVAAVSARSKHLVALLTPEESRLGELQDGYVAEQERIKREAAQREQERVEAIAARIHSIRDYPAVAATATIEECKMMQEAISQVVIDDSYAEFQRRASIALADAKSGVAAVLAAKVAAYEDAARIKAELEAAAEAHAAEVAEFNRKKAIADEERRQEHAKEQAEAAKQAAQAAAMLAAERAKAKAEQDERDRAIAEDRAKLAEEQAKFNAERAAIIAEIEAERQRVAEEEAKAASIKKAEEDAIAAQQAEADGNADDAEAERRAATSEIRHQIDEILDKIDDEGLCRVLEFAQREYPCVEISQAA